MTLADSERRVVEMSAEKKKVVDELSALRADMERELVVSQGLKDKL